MLWTSQLIAHASGSMGGITAAHNRGGLYFRQRVVPSDPATARQTLYRQHFAAFVFSWNNLLTQTERDTWDVYAANVPMPGPLGAMRHLTGFNHYIRSTVARFNSGIIGSPSVAPLLFDIGGFTPITDSSCVVIGQWLRGNLTFEDDWCAEVGSSMLFYGGKPQNPGVKFYKGPYRFAGRRDGTTPVTPVAAYQVRSDYAFAAGQRMFWRCVVTRLDGRYSVSQQVTTIATQT